MVIAEINTVTYGSTGHIMFDIAEAAREKGYTVYTFSPNVYIRNIKQNRCIKNHRYYGSITEHMLHKLCGEVSGLNGYFSYFSTRKLLKYLDEIHVNIIHLHNLHQFCINLPMLFDYIRGHRIKTIWTLHDCWAFTGHCAHYTAIGCNRWKIGCGNCPQKMVYPRSIIDTTSFMWRKKKKIFSNIEDMTIVTPSEWLAKEISHSYLKEYTCKVINNGIDLEIFSPCESNFREQYAIGDKFLILGCASVWGERKGLDVFFKLFNHFNSKYYQFVLVGTNEKIDKMLPRNVISIHRTNSPKDLAEIYSAADLFVNPTFEDNYPTVNMESIACGTPVLTFDTGGSPEMLDSNSGSVVPYGDIRAMVREIERIYVDRPYKSVDCIKRSKFFDKREKFNSYVDLYENT